MFYKEEWTVLRRILQLLDVLSNGQSLPKSMLRRKCKVTSQYKDLDVLLEKGYVSEKEIGRAKFILITEKGTHLLNTAKKLMDIWGCRWD